MFSYGKTLQIRCEEGMTMNEAVRFENYVLKKKVKELEQEKTIQIQKNK